jgi:hypothetical protein
MAKFPNIRISIPKPSQQAEEIIPQLEPVIVSRYKKQISSLRKAKCWDDSILDVVFTSDINATISEFNQKWGTVHAPITNEKEYSAFSKSIYNPQGEHAILLPIVVLFVGNDLNNNLQLLDELFIYQSMDVFSKNLLPDELYELWSTPIIISETEIEKISKWLLANWCCHKFTNELFYNGLNKAKEKPGEHKIYLTNFKRNLKKLLFEINSDALHFSVRDSQFLNKYFSLFDQFILRLIENESSDQKILLAESPESKIIYDILSEINLNYQNLLNKKDINPTKLSYHIKDFGKLYKIHIYNNPDRNSELELKINADPKLLFKGEIVETETRIVAFIDILGFSKMIEDYDSNPTSTLLQDLNEVFSKSINETFNQFKLKSKDSNLEYKLFSDNLCVSIPFYDSEADFFTQFQVIIHLVRAYQALMMQKGYFVRGAITIGSYYSNQNMIFSNGLVRAYNMEHKEVIYPRVMLDDKIVKRLESCSALIYLMKGNKDVIVIDKNDSNYFLNPYINITHLFESLKPSILEIFEEESKDPLVNSAVKSLFSMIDNLSVYSRAKNDDESNEIADQVNSIQKIIKEKKVVLNAENDKYIIAKYDWLLKFNSWILNPNEDEFQFFLPDPQNDLNMNN